MKKNKRGNNEGCVYHRPDGRWSAIITIPQTGKRRTLYRKTRQEVAKKLNETITKIDNKTYVEPSNIKVGEFLNTWLWKYEQNNVRPTTFSSYELHIRKHIIPALGNTKLQNLNPDQIQDFINTLQEKGLSPKTIRNIHNTLLLAMNQALANNILTRNVCQNVSLPRREKPEIRVLSQLEQNTLLRAIEGEKSEMAVVLDLSTGLRLGELLALTWDDIDLENGVIRITKSLYRIQTKQQSYEEGQERTKLVIQPVKTQNGVRSVPIPANVLIKLIQHKTKQLNDKNEYENKAFGDYNPINYVFCSSVGTPIEPRSLIRSFHRMVKNAGINKANIHSLRHTYATRLLEAGVAPKIVQELLGHSSITITLDTYTHVLPETKTEAIAKLDQFFCQ